MTDRTFVPQSGRQQRIAGYIDVDFAKGVIASGVPLKAFWIPAGAFDITGNVTPLVAFNSGTSDVLDVGTVGTGNANLSAGNIHVTTAIALTTFPVQSPQGYWLYVKWTGVGTAATAGKIRLKLEYLMENRAQFDHGEDR